MQLQRAIPPRETSPATSGPPLVEQPASAEANRGPEPGSWSSRQLFGSRQEVQIAHGDSIYRLRITALGKLILTK